MYIRAKTTSIKVILHDWNIVCVFGAYTVVGIPITAVAQSRGLRTGIR